MSASDYESRYMFLLTALKKELIYIGDIELKPLSNSIRIAFYMQMGLNHISEVIDFIHYMFFIRCPRRASLVFPLLQPFP